MMVKSALTEFLLAQDRYPEPLIRVFDAARTFTQCRERLIALNNALTKGPIRLSDAIDRDFLEFDLDIAARALRDAVLAVELQLSGMPLPAEDQRPRVPKE